MVPNSFNREEHIYRNAEFVELVKDAIRFFQGTPVHSLPPPERFVGTGVYAIYCTSQTGIYAKFGEINRLAYDVPIYVGKAVPKGWRQSRTTDKPGATSAELFSRLREHCRSISDGDELNPADFKCRFVLFEAETSDMISTVEAALIKLHRPVWNTVLDGFGNHTPGAGRFEQAPSDWDVLHPGRDFAARCKGKPTSLDVIKGTIADYMNKVS